MLYDFTQGRHQPRGCSGRNIDWSGWWWRWWWRQEKADVDESPPAAVIRGVLQAPILHSALIRGPGWNPTGMMRGACFCFRGGWGKEQTTEWYKPVARGKRSTLMEVNQWLTDWRREKSSLLCSMLKDWKALLFYPQNIFCTSPICLISSHAEVWLLLRLLSVYLEVIFSSHIIYRWISQCFSVKLQLEA